MISFSSLFLCFLSLSLSSAGASNGRSFAEREADMLIRGLNLSPKLDVNIVEEDPRLALAAAGDDSPRLVETSFRFPFLAAGPAAGETVQGLGHHAGYYRLAHTKGASMFYYFFESRNKNASAPVVIWLSGGPGCSGSLALFYENGPFHLTKNSTLVWNEFGWDQASNLIYVDQPTGTGFSYSTSTDDLRHTSEEAAGDFYDFLQAFFEKHPELAKNDFFITGESYAGHYIPAFAALVHQKNKNKEGIHINLKGLAIGNGLTNVGVQYKAYPEYALDMKLINKTQYDYLMTRLVPICQEAIEACVAKNSSGSDLDCLGARQTCQTIFTQILLAKEGINYYDIRKECVGDLCYDFSNVDSLLNNREVQRALGVKDISFISCSPTVYKLMSGDWAKNYEVKIPPMLDDGIKILIYAGEYDLICNWLGNSRWVESMEWSGQKKYLSAKAVPFKVDGVDAGLSKSYGGLNFLKVFNAGHLVPMDQPKASLEMLRRWMQGQPL